MAINKKLIYSQLSKANFIKNSNGLNNLTAKDSSGNCGNISWTSIIWTSDGYMWTHGIWYDCTATNSTDIQKGVEAYNALNLANSDVEGTIDKWDEVVDFLSTVTESDTIASVLLNYVTKDTAQTITGSKTFSNPISGDLLGNATTADRLKNSVTLWGQSFNGSASITSAPNLYIGTTQVQTSSANQALAGITYLTTTSTATIGGALIVNGNTTIGGTSAFKTTNIYGDTTITSNGAAYALGVYRKDTKSYISAIAYYAGSSKTLLGSIGIGGTNSTSVLPLKPYWNDGTTYYLIPYSTANSAVGSSTSPIYVDENGLIQTCNLSTTYASYSSVGYAEKATTLAGYGITDAASSSHTHGNINNNGTITSEAITPAGNATANKGDYIIISDASATNPGTLSKGILIMASVSSLSTTTKFLREDGTWAVPSYITNTNTATAADNILDGSNSGTEITYAPYSTQLSKLSFDTSSTAPTITDRLNLNGNLYSTNIYTPGIVQATGNITGADLYATDSDVYICANTTITSDTCNLHYDSTNKCLKFIFN